MRFRIERQHITENGEINTNGCTSVSFANVGTTNAYINGELLEPGSFMSDDGEQGEINGTSYTVRFDTGTGNLLIKTKIYDI